MDQVSARTTSARDALRQGTQAQHGEIARIPAMQRLFSADFTGAEYADHLARLLGFFEPLERVAAQHAGCSALRHDLTRAASLRGDLSQLGWSQREIERTARCTELPALTAVGTWGYLYVSLGSMLGGRMIAEHLRSVFGTGVALEFYGVGAGDGDARWTAFCNDLERTLRADLPEICVAASATFAAYAVWMRGPLAVSGAG